jgi:flavin reductase (DIM6/NTAB) family NADH-FMN oxidoreductase RutF
VTAAGEFGVNILSENDGELAERFAKPAADKFAGVDVIAPRGTIHRRVLAAAD